MYRKFLFILFRLRFAIYLFSLKNNRIYDEVVQSDLYLQSKLLVVLYGKKINKQNLKNYNTSMYVCSSHIVSMFT